MGGSQHFCFFLHGTDGYQFLTFSSVHAQELSNKSATFPSVRRAHISSLALFKNSLVPDTRVLTLVIRCTLI